MNEVTNLWDFLKWLSAAVGLAAVVYFAFTGIVRLIELYRDAKDLAILNNLKTMIRGLTVTDANYDIIITELDQIEYLSQPATRLKDEFLKRFDAIAKKRNSTANYRPSQDRVRFENRLKTLEAELDAIEKEGKSNCKTLDDLNVLMTKQQNLQIRFNEISELLEVKEPAPEIVSKKKAEKKLEPTLELQA